MRSIKYWDEGKEYRFVFLAPFESLNRTPQAIPLLDVYEEGAHKYRRKFLNEDRDNVGPLDEAFKWVNSFVAVGYDKDFQEVLLYRDRTEEEIETDNSWLLYKDSGKWYATNGLHVQLTSLVPSVERCEHIVKIAETWK